jgi:hypothetical protein
MLRSSGAGMKHEEIKACAVKKACAAKIDGVGIGSVTSSVTNCGTQKQHHFDQLAAGVGGATPPLLPGPKASESIRWQFQAGF